MPRVQFTIRSLMIADLIFACALGFALALATGWIGLFVLLTSGMFA